MPCIESLSFQLVIIFPNITQGDIFQERFCIKLKKKSGRNLPKSYLKKFRSVNFGVLELIRTGQEVWPSNSPNATDFLFL